jgi:hypothetical protein
MGSVDGWIVRVVSTKAPVDPAGIGSSSRLPGWTIESDRGVGLSASLANTSTGSFQSLVTITSCCPVQLADTPSGVGFLAQAAARSRKTAVYLMKVLTVWLSRSTGLKVVTSAAP